MRIEPLPRASTAMQSVELDQAAATQKQQRLFDSMRSLDSLLVALSGGADFRLPCLGRALRSRWARARRDCSFRKFFHVMTASRR